MHKNAVKKRIDYSPPFLKSFERAPLKIQKAFDRRFNLFIANPKHPLLRTHDLVGKYSGYRSFNVTGDWRALYRESENTIYFMDIGTHSQLYG